MQFSLTNCCNFRQFVDDGFVLCAGFFDKAKKKIMGDRDTNPFSEQGSSNGGDGGYAMAISGYDPSWWEAQDLGG